MKTDQRKRQHIMTAWAVLLVFGVAALPLQAQTWDGNSDVDGGDGVNWSDGLNWNGDTVPVNNANPMTFDDTDVPAGTLTADTPRDVYVLNVNNTSGTFTWDLDGDILDINEHLQLGYETGPSDLVLQNGTLRFETGVGFRLGYNNGGDGKLTHSANAKYDSSATDGIWGFYVGVNENNAGSTRGEVDWSAAPAGSFLRVHNSWNTRIGYGQMATGTVTLSSSAGATNIFGPSSGQQVHIRVGDAIGHNADGEWTYGELDAGSGKFTGHMSFIDIGFNDGNTGGSTGLFDLQDVASGSTIDTYGWDTRIGGGRQARGTLLLGSNIDVSLGQSSSQRIQFKVGDSRGRNAAGMSTTGTVETAGGQFNIHASYIDVGLNQQNSGAAVGIADLTNSAPGSGIQTYGWDTRIGVGREARGTLLLGENMSSSIGQDVGTRASLYVGYSEQRNPDGVTTTGLLYSAAGDISFYLNANYIGYNDTTTGSATGVVDLAAVTNGHFYTHGNNTRIGYGGLAHGRLLLSDAMTVQIGTNTARTAVSVGNSNTRNASGETTYGLLDGSNVVQASIDASSFYVGANDTTAGSATGKVDFSAAQAGEITTSGSQTRIGFGRDAHGTVLVSTNVTVELGETTSRTWLRVGGSETRNQDTNTTYGLWEGAFGGHFGHLWVGRNDASAGSATGIVSGAETPSGVVTMDDQLQVGYGRNAVGTLALGATDDEIGVSNNRNVLIGFNNSKAGTLTSGTMTKDGGSIVGTWETVYVGHNNNDAAITVEGTLDLTNTTIGAAGIYINNQVRVGEGGNATGVVRLPEGGVYHNSHFYLGDNDSGGNTGGTGLLELHGTSFTNSHYFDVYASGQLDIKITGQPAGFTQEETATDRIRLYRSTDAILINFDSPTVVPSASAPYYGLRWAGGTTHTNQLQTWLDSGAIDVSVSSGASVLLSDLVVDTYNDGTTDWAYIGFTNSSAGLAVEALSEQTVTDVSADLRGQVVLDASGTASLGFYWWAQSTPASSNFLAYTGSHPGQGGTFVQNLGSLSPDTAYQYQAWADDGSATEMSPSTITFTTAGDPTIATAGGAVKGVPGEVELNAEITRTDGANTIATIYWGDDDAGIIKGDWDHSYTFAGTTTTDDVAITASNLLYGVQYYYRAHVTNTYGETWSSATVEFTARATGDPGPLEDGLVMWANAGDLGLANGATVTNWADSSDAANDLDVYSGDPSFVASSASFNGEPAVDFDGNDSIETTTSFTQPYTVFSVARYRGTDNERVITSGNVNWFMGWHGGNIDRMHANGWVDAGGTAGNTDAHLYMAFSESSPGYTAFFGTSGQIASNGNNSSIGPLSLGGYNGNLTESSEAEVAEVIIYDRILTDSERLDVGGYLADKYGLSTTYFSGLSRLPSLELTTDSADVSSPDADLKATFSASGSVYTVYAVWGQTDEGENYGAWDHQAEIDTYSDQQTTITITNEATGLDDPAFYYYRFFASNIQDEAWSDVDTFTVGSVSSPTITNQTATGIAQQAATLSAELQSDGNANTTVTLFWGQSNGGQSASGWGTQAGIADFGTQAAGTIATNLTSSHLTADTEYYYIFRAVNALGTNWSHTTGQKFTTHGTSGGPHVWNGDGNGLNWNDQDNWDTDQVPNSGSTVHFDDTAGTGSMLLVDTDRSVHNLYVTNATGTHAFNLQDGSLTIDQRLTVGHDSGPASLVISNGTFNPRITSDGLRIGYRQSAGGLAEGSLVLTNTVLAMTNTMSHLFVGRNDNSIGDAGIGTLDLRGTLAGSRLLVRNGNLTAVGFGEASTGTVYLSEVAGVTNHFGTNFAQRVDLRIADADADNADGQTTVGHFDAGAGVLDARFGTMYIGYNDQTSGAAVATMDLTDVAAGSQLLANNGVETRIGYGRQAFGELLTGANMTTMLGTDDATRRTVHVGHTGNRNAAGMTTTGRVVATGGDFSVFADNLFIGYNDLADGAAEGLVDVSAASDGTILTTASSLLVGYGGRVSGQLLLGDNIDLEIGKTTRTDVRIGEANAKNANGESSYGELIGGAMTNATIRATHLFVGHNDAATGTATGRLDLSSALGGEVSTSGNNLRVGYGRRGHGTMLVSTNVTVTIGESSSRTLLRIGEAGNFDHAGVSSYGYYEGPLGGYMSHFWVGSHESAQNGGVTGIVKAAETPSDHSINTAGDQWRVGYGKNAHGYLYLGASDDVFGTNTSRQWVRIGHGDSRANSVSTGYVHKAGGTFEGHFSNFKVGAYAGASSTVYGELDLRDTTLTTKGIYINDPVRIGQGAGATGRVYLPSGNVYNASWLILGEGGGDGLLELNGTQWTNNNLVTVNSGSQIEVNVAGPSAGLTKLSTGAMSLTGAGAITLNFDTPDFEPTTSDPYWGLRWEGTGNLTTVSNWVHSTGEVVYNIEPGAQLQVADFNVGTYNDGATDWTYVGFTAKLGDVDPPVVTNAAASDVEYVSATLNGELLDRGGLATTMSVYWGTTDEGAGTTGWDNTNALGTYNTAPTNLSYETGNVLAQNQTYYYRFYGTNASGDHIASPVESFTTGTGATAPAIVNQTPSGLSATTATLNGNLTTDSSVVDEDTTVTLFWGTTNQGQSTNGWDNEVNFGVQTAGALSTNLTALSGSTDYYFIWYAENDIGSDWGAADGELFTTYGGNGPHIWNADGSVDIWSDKDNWDTDEVPSGSSTVIFTNTGAGSTITVDTDRSVDNLQVVNDNDIDHTFDLNSGTLTVNSATDIGRNLSGDSALVVDGGGTLDLRSNVRIGVDDNVNVDVSGSLVVTNTVLTNGTALATLHIGRTDGAGANRVADGLLDLRGVDAGSSLSVANNNEIQIGRGRRATGQLLMDDNIDVTLFATNARQHLLVGHSQGANVSGESTYGFLDAGSSDFTAHVNHFYAGENAANAGSVTGRMDFSSASGLITISANETRIGYGGRAVGEVTLGSGLDVEFGNPSRHHLIVGYSNHNTNNSEVTAGTLTASGSVFGDLAHLIVGKNDNANGTVTGRVDFSSSTGGGTLTTSGSDFQVGYGGRADGRVDFSANQTVEIGNPTRHNTAIGYHNGQTANGEHTYGAVYANGAAISADVGWLEVGRGANSGAVTGIVDFSDSPAGGAITWQGGNTYVGYGKDADGTLLLGPSDDQYGVSSHQSLLVGYNNHTAGTLTKGTFTKSGGTYEALIAYLSVGHNENNAVTAVEGDLDLSAATMGAAGIEINNDARIGYGEQATGNMHLSDGHVYVNGSLLLGDTATRNGSGLLELTRVSWTNNNTITIGETGQLDMLVAGGHNGLTKLSTGSFTINRATDAILIEFGSPSFTPSDADPYAGLRWEGDHVSTVSNWYDNGVIDVTVTGGANLDVADLTVDTYTDGDLGLTTFLGFTKTTDVGGSLFRFK